MTLARMVLGFLLAASAAFQLPTIGSVSVASTSQSGTTQSGQVVVHSVEGVGTEEVVTGVPFSATIAIDSTQTLADGNRIVNHSTEHVARDSAGRTRRELHISTLGTLPVAGPYVVLIFDPVSGLEYTLDPAQHTVRISKPRTISVPATEPSKGDARHRERRQVSRKDLGTQTIEGLMATGSRVTATIPAGALGNERPISTTVEIWYAPDLRTVVLRKRSDPRSGESVYRLTDIKRAEPDPSLFKVPPDYKVVGSDPRH